MNDTEIISGNRTIAEFMGYKFAGDGKIKPFTLTKPGEDEWFFGSWLIEGLDHYILNELRYRYSWDILIPIIKKCKELVKESEKICMHSRYHVLYARINSGLLRLEISETAQAVCSFITWYNKNKV